MKKVFLIGLCVLSSCAQMNTETAMNNKSENQDVYSEMYRPQFHFSPPSHWMNDPNGLLYENGVYHLFYQHYPEDIVWGPMHWGHAISKDLVHWENRPIALYPDEHGYIFSGSAVFDKNNSSGLGTDENPPLIAIFTYHHPEKAKLGTDDHQTQGIAYSLDHGENWTMYKDNPVIKNEDKIRDFRDPKVFWHEESSSWIMCLVAGDHLQLYRSENLIDWEYASSFGHNQGAHGGVWECPDLFPLEVEGETHWVLLISINPGAPNGGSGTQYFTGEFDGYTFSSDQEEHLWIDLGPDNYAGVTYNDVPNEDRIFIGWMSNWNYANLTPTQKWRSSMTIPRVLSLRKTPNGNRLVNTPISKFDSISKIQPLALDQKEARQIHLQNDEDFELMQSRILFETELDFEMNWKNADGNTLLISADGQEILVDRSNSGRVDFEDTFATIPIKASLADLKNEKVHKIEVFVDHSSVELFIDGGLVSLTVQVFPEEPFSDFSLNADKEVLNFKAYAVERVWD